MITNYNESGVVELIKFLQAKSMPTNGICGLLGNLYVESKLFPNNLQNSYNTKLGMSDEEYTQAVDNGSYLNFVTDRAGYGIAQWTSSGRKQGLLTYANSLGKSIGDMVMQVEWLWQELKTSYKKNTLDVLMDENSSLELCARTVMTKFERPANQSEQNQMVRVGYAQDFYNKYFSFQEDIPAKKNLVVGLSAGHYKYTSGKRCLKSIDPNETREWVLNARIMDIVQELLKPYDVSTVRLDDVTGEKLIDLPTRKTIAENNHADIYIAMHHNAGINGGSGGGTVVYYYPTEINKKQATSLYNDIIYYTQLKGNRSRPISSTTSLYEVYAPSMASYLVENGFMDSTTDTPIILTDAHAEKTARGIFKFLVEEYGLKKKDEVAEEPQVEEVYVIEEPEQTVYTVAKGDTLSKIGRMYNVSWKDIAKANNISFPYLIKVGQEITIP